MLRIIKGFAASVVIAFLIMFSSAFAVQADDLHEVPCEYDCSLEEYTSPSEPEAERDTDGNQESQPGSGDCTNCQPTTNQDTGTVETVIIPLDYTVDTIEISPEYLDELTEKAEAGEQATMVAWFLGMVVAFLCIVLWLVVVAKRQ